MKRRELLKHLETHGCELLREGGNHSIYVNRRTQKSSAVPRHKEISTFLARKVCRDLEVPMPVGAREEITSYDAG
ncbi:MAG: type II toxin-antitoxin system HicA family toxin [Chloroflexi bacterium]|nr:type II toxin-antitoxin system HicA family toxin [Chloroflexota bacterium]